MRLPALYVISAVFGGLLIVRAVAVSAEALAPKTDMTAADEASPSATVSALGKEGDSDLDDAASTSSQCLTGDVLDVLQADRAKLSERLTAVTAREKTLATLEVKLKDQMAQIEVANMDSRKSYSISIIMAAKNAKYR